VREHGLGNAKDAENVGFKLLAHVLHFEFFDHGHIAETRVVDEDIDGVRFGEEVYDGGADGDADTPADNALLEVQGLFVP